MSRIEELLKDAQDEMMMIHEHRSPDELCQIRWKISKKIRQAIALLAEQPKCKTCNDSGKTNKLAECLDGKVCMVEKNVPCPDCADAQLAAKDEEITGLQEQLIKMCRVFHSIDCVCKWCNIAKERAVAGT